MKARIAEDGQTFELTGEHYYDQRPITALGHTLDFYRGLRDRKGGAYSQHYVETVEQLEAVQREARGMGVL